MQSVQLMLQRTPALALKAIGLVADATFHFKRQTGILVERN